MSQNKVVSIKSHPKYRDVAALRRYLTEGQDHMGTKVDMTRFYDVEDPEIQHQLYELNEWAKALTEIPGLNLSHGANVGKTISADTMLSMFPQGMKKGEFYDFRAIPSILGEVTLNPFQVFSEPPRGSMAVNRITMDNTYKVKGRDDANPDA